MKPVKLMLIITLLAGFVITGLAPSTATAKVRLKLATLAPDGSTWMKAFNKFAREIKKQTKGEVKFKVYSGGVSGDEKDVLRKIRVGQLHGAAFTGIGMGDILPMTRILETPLLFNNLKEFDYVRDQIKPVFTKKFAEKGFVLLALLETGWVNIFSNKKVTSKADMKGIKAWAWEGDPMSQIIFNELKLVPIPLSLPDVMTSLQTGLIDAVYAPPMAAVALQWFTKVKYVTDVKLANAIAGILIQTKRFDKIKPEHKKIMFELAAKLEKELNAKSRQENQEAMETIKKNGIKTVAVDDKNMKELVSVCSNVKKKMVGKIFPASLLSQVEGYIQEFRTNQKQAK